MLLYSHTARNLNNKLSAIASSSPYRFWDDVKNCVSTCSNVLSLIPFTLTYSDN